MFSFRSLIAARTPVVCLVIGTAFMVWSQAPAPKPAAPLVGKSLRYCNPLPIEASSRDGSPQGVSLGDVTVVKEGDKYYLFATGGGAWISSNLVDWKYQAVEVRGSRIPVAPHVVKYKGAFYMSGNNAPLYKASDILGPYELAGPWKNEKGEPWTGVTNGRTWNGRIEFTAGRGRFGSPQPASQPPTGSVAFRYKIEASRDGQTFATILDKTGNSVTKYTEFDELPPTQCRYVRLFITDWPHISNSPLGIVEFTVFGKALETPKH